jgi:aryl-alcohol dehydrogenase-like predicted oxidoreductase
MEMRRLGHSDVRLSAISFGCWIVGVDWWGHYTDSEGVRLMQAAHDCGITFFDNGDAYGNGRAEHVLGEFLRAVPRDGVQVGSKFGYDFYSDPGQPGSHRERRQDFSPAFMRRALEQTLARLRTDYLDLYMAHNIKLPQFSPELFSELEKVQREGKIRAWGVSLGPAIGWREEGFVAMGEHGAAAVQSVFNLFEQNPGREFCEMARASHAGILARVHDNSSILKDKLKLETPIGESDHRKFRDEAWKVYGLQKLERVRKYARAHGMSTHQLACKWLLQQPGLTSVTATLLSEAEVREAADSVDKPPLTQAELDEIALEYSRDWKLGDAAHPCDLKSSTAPAGKVLSTYVAPPTLIA